MPDIPEEVKRQAMSATQALSSRIEAVEQTGNPVLPQATHNPQLGEKIGKRVAEMQRSGYDADEVSKALTKDNFGRGE